MNRGELNMLLADIFFDLTGQRLQPLQDDLVLQEHVRLDSLDMMSLAIDLHERTGIALEVADIPAIVTVGDLLDLLQAKGPAMPSSNKAA